MTNLLQETIEAIKEAGKTEADIIFIGSEKSGHSCTWEEYKVLADKYYVNKGFPQAVALDLIIAFNDDAKLIRGESQGLEWWIYVPSFVMPKAEDMKPIATVIAQCLDDGWSRNDGWSTLARLNDTTT